eukprot:m.9783 g.9783  ORF g.9783 m.9783 type:complete len:555 (-) comp7923_c0_seq1:36-1700(-)
MGDKNEVLISPTSTGIRSQENSPLLSGGESDVDATKSTEPKSTLRFGKKLAFALGSPPNALTHALIGFLFNAFLLQVVKLSPRTVGGIALAGRVWDAIADPIVGIMTTRTRSRWGSFKPWLVGSIIPVVLTFIAIWSVPPWWDENSRVLYTLITYLMYNLTIGMYNVPYTSLTMHLSYVPSDIASAVQYAAIVTALSTLLTAVLTFGTAEIVSGFADLCGTSEDSFCAYSPLQLAHMALGVISGAICVACGVCVAVNIGEQVIAKGAESPQESVWKGFKLVFTNKSNNILISMFIWVWMGQAVIQANFVVWCQMPGGLDVDFVAASMMLLSMLGSCTVSVPFWFIVVAKIGKKKTFTTGMACLLLPTAAFYFLPPDASLGLKHLAFVIYGCPLACVYLVPSLMLPDVINDAAVRHNGVRREALFFSYFVMFQKFGAGAAIYLSSEVLESYGYDSTIPASEQADEVSDALRALIGIFVPGFMLFGLLLSLWYPITPDEEKRIAVKLKLIRDDRDADNIKHTNGYSTPVVDLADDPITAYSDDGGGNASKRRVLEG